MALDVHRDFCEVAIVEAGELRSAGRLETKADALELFARSLGAHDYVALEVTGNAWQIARVIEPRVAGVIAARRAIAGSARRDRLDARALAKLLWAGQLDAVWMPDERIRAMRRRVGRRTQLARQETKCTRWLRPKRCRGRRSRGR